MTTGTYTATAPSKWVDLDGPVHYVDHGGPAETPLAVLVHGLGGSHANWAPFAARLSQEYRVLAVDLPGFGLSPGRPRPVTVPANRRLLTRFLKEVAGGEPVILAGNSMGGLISTLHASRAPETVSHLVLIDPALPIGFGPPDPLVVATAAAFAVPAPVARQLSRWRRPPTVDQITSRILRLVMADPERVPREVLDQHIALARARRAIPGADADLVVAARSLTPFLAGRRRYDAMLARLTMPVLLYHGTEDRLMPIRVARRVARAFPRFEYVEARGYGHAPMLEAPGPAAEAVTRFLAAN